MVDKGIIKILAFENVQLPFNTPVIFSMKW